MKKKLLSLALVAAMALSVVACGGKEEAAETPAEAAERLRDSWNAKIENANNN